MKSVSRYIDKSSLESPVGLVLTNHNGRNNAMTVSFFSEAAHHPTTLWVSIAVRSYTHELILSSGRFTLAVLHRGQREIATVCGTRSGRDEDKCSKLSLRRSSTGFLFLNHALANIACAVRSTYPLGDHTIFIADILSGETESRVSTSRHLLISDLV